MPNEAEPAPQPDAGADPPTVSAVIPAYNAAETIERALNSVYAQTYPSIIEVIVVDDGSTDATAQIIRDKFPQVTLIQQENAGNAGARNTGVAAATGEYIAFLDADDEWLPEKTASQVAVMEDLPGAAICLCKQVLIAPSGEAILRGTQQNAIRQYTFRDWLGLGSPPWRESYSGCVSAWVCRTACLRAIGGFDGRLRQCVDVETLLRTTARGFVVIGAPGRHLRRHLQERSVSRGEGAELRKFLLWYRVTQRYDPCRRGREAQLLSDAEFAAMRGERLRDIGFALISSGRLVAGSRALRRANCVGAGTPLQKMKSAIGARWPALLAAYSRPAFRRGRGALLSLLHTGSE